MAVAMEKRPEVFQVSVCLARALALEMMSSLGRPFAKKIAPIARPLVNAIAPIAREMSATVAGVRRTRIPAMVVLLLLSVVGRTTVVGLRQVLMPARLLLLLL